MKNAASPHPPGKQEYRTPREFIEAVEWRFGVLDLDLAASDGDEVCPNHITPEMDSLAPTTLWPLGGGPKWLNPPFKKFEEFSEKCAWWTTVSHLQDRRRTPSDVRVGVKGMNDAPLIVMLALLSADAQWWKRHVRGKARVEAISPRITFVGEEFAYPKPLCICVYDPRYPDQSDSVGYWRWKK